MVLVIDWSKPGRLWPHQVLKLVLNSLQCLSLGNGRSTMLWNLPCGLPPETTPLTATQSGVFMGVHHGLSVGRCQAPSRVCLGQNWDDPHRQAACLPQRVVWPWDASERSRQLRRDLTVCVSALTFNQILHVNIWSSLLLPQLMGVLWFLGSRRAGGSETVWVSCTGG